MDSGEKEEPARFILFPYKTLVTLLDLVKGSDVVEPQEHLDELGRSHVEVWLINMREKSQVYLAEGYDCNVINQ